jgi:hypothetical protein
MTKIKQLAEWIDDELHGAKNYAEKAIECKAMGNTSRYNDYKTMASQELTHADALHTMVVQDIEELRKVYPNPPSEMMDKWDYDHKKYVEKSAWIKQMLTL